MSSRSRILDSIREGADACAGIPVFDIPLPVPEFSERTDDPAALFSENLKRVHGSCEVISSWRQFPSSVNRYLERIGEEKTVVASADELFHLCDWDNISVEYRIANQWDRVSVTKAFAGIAETGTVVMVSSGTSPVTLNFLPESNIVALQKFQLLSSMEDLWPLLDNTAPRAVNLITGPSKTADIEQTIVYGAHGPRRFHVVIIES